MWMKAVVAYFKVFWNMFEGTGERQEILRQPLGSVSNAGLQAMGV
jgi:hypothetical protein